MRQVVASQTKFFQLGAPMHAIRRHQPLAANLVSVLSLQTADTLKTQQRALLPASGRARGFAGNDVQFVHVLTRAAISLFCFLDMRFRV